MRRVEVAVRGAAGLGRAIGTHVDEAGRPRMVDVGAKAVTRRTATARAEVALPPAVATALREHEAAGGRRDGWSPTGKGPVFTTATIAATMAAKDTSRMIPFCHPLPIERCDVTCEPSPDCSRVTIDATVGTTHKTGVEMEALTAASVAALTVYDMLKGIPGAQPGLCIEATRLLRKTGGKTDITEEAR